MESGAYVLGALLPVERSTYERHLPQCPSCRDEVAQLAGLPGLLGRLDAGTVSSIGQPNAAPPALLDSMLLAARTERLRIRRVRRRRVGALLAAACLALLVGLGVVLTGGTSEASPVVVTMAPVDPDIPVSAMVGYWRDPDGGTDISVACVYARATQYTGRAQLDLWVFPRDGGAGRTVGSWDAGPGDRLTFWAKSPLPSTQIDRMEIRRGDTTLLVYTAT
jgi:hypothetical protein